MDATMKKASEAILTAVIVAVITSSSIVGTWWVVTLMKRMTPNLDLYTAWMVAVVAVVTAWLGLAWVLDRTRSAFKRRARTSRER